MLSCDLIVPSAERDGVGLEAVLDFSPTNVAGSSRRSRASGVVLRLYDGTVKDAEEGSAEEIDVRTSTHLTSRAKRCGSWAELKSIVESALARGDRFAWTIRTRKPYPDAHFPRRGVHAPEGDVTTWPSRDSMRVIRISPGATQGRAHRSTFTESTRTEVAEFFRPNLFANTPDILHAYPDSKVVGRHRDSA